MKFCLHTSMHTRIIPLCARRILYQPTVSVPELHLAIRVPPRWCRAQLMAAVRSSSCSFGPRAAGREQKANGGQLAEREIERATVLEVPIPMSERPMSDDQAMMQPA